MEREREAHQEGQARRADGRARLGMMLEPLLADRERERQPHQEGQEPHNLAPVSLQVMRLEPSGRAQEGMWPLAPVRDSVWREECQSVERVSRDRVWRECQEIEC